VPHISRVFRLFSAFQSLFGNRFLFLLSLAVDTHPRNVRSSVTTYFSHQLCLLHIRASSLRPQSACSSSRSHVPRHF
jgi:hypothetical protein